MVVNVSTEDSYASRSPSNSFIASEYPPDVKAKVDTMLIIEYQDV